MSDPGWLRVGELGELQAFVDRYWRAGHVLARDAELARWQWRHPDDPQLLSVLVARDDDGALEAFLGLVPVAFSKLGERVEGAWLALWTATPDAQARRVGLGLLLAARERFPVLACLGFNETARRIYEALAFTVRPLERWVRILDPEAAARLAGGSHEVGTDRLQTRDTPLGTLTSGAVTDPLGARTEMDVERWDNTWHGRFAPGLVGTWRDADYLTRRYVEHPRFRYAVHAGDALLVHRVEQARGRDETAVRIVELLGDDGALDELVRVAEDSGAAFADFFCAEAGESAATLEAAGFRRESDLDVAVPSRLQPVEPGSAALSLAIAGVEPGAPLYVTRSDGDQDRPN